MGEPHTGPAATGAFPPVDVHTALLYRGAAEYAAAVVAFVRAGLDAGEAVTVAVPATNLDMLRDECGAAGLAGDVRWVDAAVVGRNPGRIVPAVLHPLVDRTARAVVEIAWPRRTPAELGMCARHEAFSDQFLVGTGLRMLCPYDVDHLTEDSVRSVMLTHATVLEGGAARANPDYAPRRVLGHSTRPPEPPERAATLDVGVGELAAARRLVADQAVGFGLPRERVGDAALVVTELITNSIEHGGGLARFSAWTTDDELVCEIADKGRFADPFAGLRPAPVGQPHGRGLMLVNTLSDLVTIHADSAGTVIRVHFTRS